MNRGGYGLDPTRGRVRIGRATGPRFRRRAMFAGPRRSPWIGRSILMVAMSLVTLTLVAAATNRASAGAAVPDSYRTSAAVAPGEPGAIRPALEPTAVFAVYDDLALHLPSPLVQLVGFHEASHADALTMLPRGLAESNENRTKYAAPADVEGPGYRIMSSRGRRQPATTAVDLVLAPGEAVRSVVDGTVVDVRPYLLYGRYPDTRIEISPTGRPDLRVVLIHVSDAVVEVGDPVVAGQTVLAGSSNVFGFSSQVDRYLPNPTPHVHVEVKPASALGAIDGDS